MPHRRFAIAAATLALAGAGAATAVAATPRATTLTPLAQAVQKGIDTTAYNIPDKLGSGPAEIRMIREFITNAYLCDQVVDTVQAVPADAAQEQYKTEWLNGERLSAHLDVQLANATITAEGGNVAAGQRAFRALIPTQEKVNRETGLAEESLGLQGPH